MRRSPSTREGRILAGRVQVHCNLGAYLSRGGSFHAHGQRAAEFPRALPPARCFTRAPMPCSPTPRPSAPTAAPGARKACTTWSGCWTRRPASWASTGWSFAGATSCTPAGAALRPRCPSSATTAVTSPAILEAGLAAGGLGRFRGAASRSPLSRGLLRGLRARLLPGGHRPAGQGDGRHPLPRGRLGADGLRLAQLRAGPRRDLRPDRQRPARASRWSVWHCCRATATSSSPAPAPAVRAP